MTTVTLNIDGMTCGGCVKSVTRILSELDGVSHAEVNLENKSAVVNFDESKVKINQLVDAVEDGGYDVSVA
ncbi:heavy-metal-associated domain-containing protein [Simonsiella muelleri]|uniref:heavy-metal-associated domain-containing protein n=1 Tax=Simonsiella muelleri TaxID=72 RepID=UPI0023F1E63E|nr:copper ion binding protein [Simonsiella muelleri]